MLLAHATSLRSGASKVKRLASRSRRRAGECRLRHRARPIAERYLAARAGSRGARSRGAEGCDQVLRWLVAFALASGVGLTAHGWLAVGPLPFQAGLLLCAVGAAGLSVGAARRGRAAAVVSLNTLVCLLVGVVAVDRVWFGRERAGEGELVSYSFSEAGGRPEVFLRWHARALEEQKRSRGNTMPDPRGVNPHVLKPGTGKIFDSTWWINSLGFRGPEIEVAKGDHYRIVALGESTTFGDTLRAEDRTWPEILEARIANELVCEKPVQVINAGVPGWTLANQLARLKARRLSARSRPDRLVPRLQRISLPAERDSRGADRQRARGSPASVAIPGAGRIRRARLVVQAALRRGAQARCEGARDGRPPEPLRGALPPARRRDARARDRPRSV